VADPSRAPEGRHTLWGYAHVPAAPTGDAGRRRARADWAHAAAPFVERIQARIEAHAPGFGDTVLARKVWTPDDLELANPAMLGGDISSGSFAIDQQLLFRPGPDWWRWGSPVKGLYLAGAAVHPGGGVHGGGRDQAARQAIADHSRPGRLLLGAAAAAIGLAAFAGRRGD
jgi:phytoene dehydrogenase-like protein